MNEKELRIYHFARYCYRHKDEYAPNKETRIEGKREVRERITWAKVFERRTGESLESYIERHRHQRRT